MGSRTRHDAHPRLHRRNGGMKNCRRRRRPLDKYNLTQFRLPIRNTNHVRTSYVTEATPSDVGKSGSSLSSSFIGYTTYDGKYL